MADNSNNKTSTEDEQLQAAIDALRGELIEDKQLNEGAARLGIKSPPITDKTIDLNTVEGQIENGMDRSRLEKLYKESEEKANEAIATLNNNQQSIFSESNSAHSIEEKSKEILNLQRQLAAKKKSAIKQPNSPSSPNKPNTGLNISKTIPLREENYLLGDTADTYFLGNKASSPINDLNNKTTTETIKKTTELQKINIKEKQKTEISNNFQFNIEEIILKAIKNIINVAKSIIGLSNKKTINFNSSHLRSQKDDQHKVPKSLLSRIKPSKTPGFEDNKSQSNTKEEKSGISIGRW